MNIIIGKTSGFCYGVKRAVEGAHKEIENAKGQIYCLGEIVHNKQVVQELEISGVKFIENIKDANGTTIIRSHGVPKEIYKEAKQNDIEIKDYTCPNVLKLHKITEEFTKKGYYIFLCGIKTHPENIGTISYCNNNSYIIEKKEETYLALDKLEKSGIKKLLLISQTTYSIEEFYNIKEIIENKLPKNIELIVKNTICKSTELRQKETEEISKKVDSMIIIGGKNSSNTKKLYEISLKNCKNTVCIETKDELKKELYKNSNNIGIMAGASTPQKSIDEISNYLRTLQQ